MSRKVTRSLRAVRRRVRSSLAATLVLPLLGLVTGPVSVSAQDTPIPSDVRAAQEEDDSGWLGIGIRQLEVCPEETAAPGPECRAVHLVESVVVGGPADRAGIQPGDTLVAAAGAPLATDRGAEVLRTLRANRPLEVLVGREEGRASLRVTPERPAEGPGPVVLRMLVSPAPVPSLMEDRAPVRTVRVFRLDRGRDVLFPHREATGVRRAGRLDPESVAAHVEARMEIAMERARERMRLLKERFQDLDEERMRLLEERLEAAADPERLRAIAEAHERRWQRTLGEDHELGTHRRAMVRHRMAGAEFRPLEPDLADYFQGAEEGLLVLQVLQGTPAHELGLRAGDVVVEVDGRGIAMPGELRAAFARYPQQDSLVVKWIRKGNEMTGVLRRP